MDMFFELIGGTLLIKKEVLAKDLLKKDSDFRYFINKNKPVYRAPKIEKDSEYIKIIFDNGTDIDLNRSYQDEFKALKYKYKENIKGILYIRVTFNTISTTTLDLNGEDSVSIY